MENPYVVSSNEVSLFIQVGSAPPMQIETGITNNITYSKTLTPIYAISFENPIDLKGVNTEYSGTLTMQTGEAHTILDAINGVLPPGTDPYASMLELPPFTFTKISRMPNATLPKTVSESMISCKISSQSADTNRNEVETQTTFSFSGVGVIRSVAPLG